MAGHEAGAVKVEIPLGEPVEVRWLDSVSRGRWQSRKEIEAWAKSTAPSAIHYSVGYLLEVNERVIVLIQSKVEYDDDSDGMVAETQAIPMVAVLSVVGLKWLG